MRVCVLAALIFALSSGGDGAWAQREMLPSAPQPAGAVAAARVFVNRRPYTRPTERDLFKRGYVSDTYGLPGVARTLVRAGYAQARGKPDGWGQDLPGFGQRFGVLCGGHGD